MQIKGIGVCGGMAIAPIHYVEAPCPADINEHSDREPAQLKARLDQLTAQLQQDFLSRAALLPKREQTQDAEMLEMQAVMLCDVTFQNGVCRYLDQGYSLAAAITRSSNDQQQDILDTEDPYLMERVADVADMASRLVYACWEIPYPDLSQLDHPVVVAAEDLQPSMLVSAPEEFIQGLVLEHGSRTSHIAILAAGRELPTLVGCEDLSTLHASFREGNQELVCLDADRGTLSAFMTDQELEQARQQLEAWKQERQALFVYRDQVCATADGERVFLYGNIMEAAAAERVREYGGDGVGLFRTEFLYMNRSTLPSEEEQFAHYRAAVRKMGGKDVTIRTMDIGADKQTPALDLGREENPFLGFRAIRVCLAKPDILRTQLRAILRASAFGPVKIMFPMISRMSELDQALAILEECKAQLRQEGKAFDEAIRIGIMVEIPSVAILASQFIQKVDFFSIGSNDLTQYTLAVDRMNEKIDYLYDGLDPAVLTLIRASVQAVDQSGGGKTCGLCGELGSDPKAIPILLGLGLRHLSVNPSALLQTKRLISQLHRSDLERAVSQLNL